MGHLWVLRYFDVTFPAHATTGQVSLPPAFLPRLAAFLPHPELAWGAGAAQDPREDGAPGPVSPNRVRASGTRDPGVRPPAPPRGRAPRRALGLVFVFLGFFSF